MNARIYWVAVSIFLILIVVAWIGFVDHRPNLPSRERESTEEEYEVYHVWNEATNWTASGKPKVENGTCTFHDMGTGEVVTIGGNFFFRKESRENAKAAREIERSNRKKPIE